MSLGRNDLSKYSAFFNNKSVVSLIVSFKTRKEYPKLDAIFNNCRQVVVDSGVLRSSKLTTVP